MGSEAAALIGMGLCAAGFFWGRFGNRLYFRENH